MFQPSLNFCPGIFECQQRQQIDKIHLDMKVR